MRREPLFFERIQQAAARRWQQLEADPELAGPWRLLFRQVQSPRHVISELLQNADDAGATWASGRIEQGEFIFEHDGHDFTENEFRSLCRFGFSNKRWLHTIGFRGIGFRSVFAIGDWVDVLTPSLACRFERERFTLPQWLPDAPASQCTSTRVPLTSKEKEAALREDMARWSRSAIPLLFFRSVRALRIQDRKIGVTWGESGPCRKSRLARMSTVSGECLVIRSEEESFPDECLKELREERGEDIAWPPCDVAIVLAARLENKLYVVLPTDVTVALPFSCQGPFLQDPARTGIKDPAASPTNRWLLGRIGELAAEAMQEWLENNLLEPRNRARAYELLWSPVSGDATGKVSDEVARLVTEAFRSGVRPKRVLLGADWALGGLDDTAHLPREVLDVWSAEEACKLFAPEKKRALAREVSTKVRDRLAAWEWLEPLRTDCVLDRLTAPDCRPPKPRPVVRLAVLWSWARRHRRSRWRWGDWWQRAAIVPVADRDYLRPAEEVLPCRDRPDACSEEEWRFLLTCVEVVDSEWRRLLDELKKDPDGERETIGAVLGRSFPKDNAIELLEAYEATGIGETPRLDRIVNHALRTVFAEQPPNREQTLRLLRIAARLNVDVSEETPVYYLCADGKWRSREAGRVCQWRMDLESLLPAEWLRPRLISDCYEAGIEPQDLRQWREWLTSQGKGGVHVFPLPEKQISRTWRLSEDEFHARGVDAPEPKLKTGEFELSDWDWDPVLWEHWERKAAEGDEKVWQRVARGVLEDWSEAWKERLTMTVYQHGYTRRYQLDDGNIPSKWLQRLRGLPCVPDQTGKSRVPAELFRRTRETESLLNVEPFVREDWDVPRNEECLDTLEVRSKPTDASSLLRRLAALSQAEDPPIGHLRDLYRAIERVLSHLPVAEWQGLMGAFESGPLIRTESGWSTSRFCYRDNPQEVPGLPVIHPEFRDLNGLWDFLQVSRQPTLQDALEWLQQLPGGAALDQAIKDRVRRLLTRYPDDVWRRVGRWMNLEGCLERVVDLPWGCRDIKLADLLFPKVRSQTADLSMLDSARAADFAGRRLRLLDGTLEYRVAEVEGVSSVDDPRNGSEAWVQELGGILCRLGCGEGTDEQEVVHDRKAARRLQRTRLQRVHQLKVQPFLDREPVGARFETTVAWASKRLYVVGTSVAAHRQIVQELSRHFLTREAHEVIRDCVGRPPEWIREYAATTPELSTDDSGAGDIGDGQGPSIQVDEGGEPIPPPPVEGPWDTDGGDVEGSGPTESEEAGGSSKGASMKERFVAYWRQRGYEWDAKHEVACHPDGSVVRKAEKPFSWVWRTHEEDRHIWLSSRAWSGASGLVIPAEIWDARDHFPNTILMVPEDDTFGMHWLRGLAAEVRQELRTLTPASYRLGRKD